MIILKCPDCDAEIHCIGDFTINEGRVFRVANTPTYSCDRCTDVFLELKKNVENA